MKECAVGIVVIISSLLYAVTITYVVDYVTPYVV